MEALDILFLTLSVCTAILTVFVSVTLVYLMFILRDVVKVTDDVRALVDKINTYVTKPLMMTRSIIEFVSPFIENAESALSSRKKRKR